MIREVVTSLTLQIVSRWFRYYKDRYRKVVCVMAYQGYLLEELDIVEGLKQGLNVDPLVCQVVYTVIPLKRLLQGGDKGSQLYFNT